MPPARPSQIGPSSRPPRPTRAALAAARGRAVPDLIGPDLTVLFVGVNPGLYSAAIGHHFGHPANRFWRALYAGGFTERVLAPWEEATLLARGYGLINLVEHATSEAAELTRAELRAGAVRLGRTLRRYRPGIAAILGLGAYRVAFDRPRAVVGPQPERIGAARLWVLPDPSGLNTSYLPNDLARLFRALHAAAVAPSGGFTPPER